MSLETTKAFLKQQKKEARQKRRVAIELAVISLGISFFIIGFYLILFLGILALLKYLG